MLAPIQGVTEANYRNHYAQLFGSIDSYYAPFISPTGRDEFNPVFFDDILPRENHNTLTLIPQILGCNGVHFRDFANHIVSMGYKEINWNIGCPFKNVTRKQKGSGILPHPDLIRRVLDEVCKSKGYDLSVKMRLGLNHVDEGQIVIDLLNDYPLSEVIIHARTGSQQYTGQVDLKGFRGLSKICRHNLSYNGDVYTLKDYQHLISMFPNLNGVMLGRGALRNPFLAASIKGQVVNNKIEKIRNFHEGVYNYYRMHTAKDIYLLNKMKEFWTYTHTHLDPSGDFIRQIRLSQTISDYLKAVDNILSNGWHDLI